MSDTAGVSRRPLISWHRGGAELAPFATLAAFSSAAARGAELIEVDLRRTRDGALVCVHDAVLPGAGRVDELDWGERGAGLEREGRAIGFGRFLDELDDKDPERRSRVHLDVKEPGYEEAGVSSVLARRRPVTVTSGHAGVIRVVRRSHPGVPALLTIGTSGTSLGFAEHARLRARELLPFSDVAASGATGVAAHHLLATPALRRWCRWRGLELLIWTVDDARALERWLSRRDVDVVTTNRPLAALAIRDGGKVGE